MLIEIDNWTRDVLNNTTDYIIKPKVRTIEYKNYIMVDDLVQAIADLTDELDRQYEVINKFDNNIQIYFKGNEVIKLSPKEVQSFRDAEELLKEDLDLKEDGTILKEQYTLMLEELIKKVQDLQEQVEKQEQYIEETNNRNGW